MYRDMSRSLSVMVRIGILPRIVIAGFALVGAALLLSACGQGGDGATVPPASTANTNAVPASTPGVPAESTPTTAGAVSIGTPRVSYAEPSTGPILSQPLSSMTITPIVNPASLPPLMPDASGTLTVSSTDYGRLVELKVGDTLKLDLGTGYDWTVPDVDTSILALTTASPAGQSGQETYKAVKQGKTNLQASGDPPCRKSQPPCGLASRVLDLNITVK